MKDLNPYDVGRRFDDLAPIEIEEIDNVRTGGKCDSLCRLLALCLEHVDVAWQYSYVTGDGPQLEDDEMRDAYENARRLAHTLRFQIRRLRAPRLELRGVSPGRVEQFPYVFAWGDCEDELPSLEQVVEMAMYARAFEIGDDAELRLYVFVNDTDTETPDDWRPEPRTLPELRRLFWSERYVPEVVDDGRQD